MILNVHETEFYLNVGIIYECYYIYVHTMLLCLLMANCGKENRNKKIY